jgi:Xaa-Pro aminopeptidase
MPQHVPAPEIAARIQRFQHILGEQGLDGAILVHKANLYYLTGTDQDAHIWVPVDGSPLLMVRKSLSRALKDSALEDVVALPGLSRLPILIREHTGRLPTRLGLELDVLPTRFFFSYQKLFPGAELLDVSHGIRGVRMIKSPYEMECIQKAAGMADRMYQQVPAFLQDSRTETELAARVEAFYRTQGHPGLVRTHRFNLECVYGQVMAGAGAAAASDGPGPTGGEGLGAFYSQGSGSRVIGTHEPILVDHAANAEGYIADQTRIFSIGALPDDLLRAHQAMLEIQEAVAQRAVPGAVAGDLFRLAMEMAQRAGLKEGFMGYPEPVPFVAHGVGLEIDDWPIIGKGDPTVLEEGMVLALEPKVVFPGRGVVGIENTFVVTKEGMKKLNRFPDGVCVC